MAVAGLAQVPNWVLEMMECGEKKHDSDWQFQSLHVANKHATSLAKLVLVLTSQSLDVSAGTVSRAEELVLRVKDHFTWVCRERTLPKIRTDEKLNKTKKKKKTYFVLSTC